MRKVFKLFFALAAVVILCGCTNIKSTNPISDLVNDPEKILTGKVVFSNQSDDPYAVTVTSSDGVDQFSVSGNSNVTRTYSVGNYKIHLKQTDGYTFYASEFDATLSLSVEGATLCWTNKEVWWKK